MDLGTFEQVAAVLVVCVVAGALAVVLRQPLILGLIAGGIAVGPSALGLIGASEEVELLAQIGIALLLFVVGLKLDVRVVRRLGPIALSVGLGQIALTFTLGLLVALGLGLSAAPAIYLAMALTFSSTIIVIKVLTDQRMLDQLHGQISLGVLVVQDIMVVVAMIAITAFGATDVSLVLQIGSVLARGAALVAITIIVSRLVATRVLEVVARQAELLVLTAIAWAIALAAVSVLLGFSAEVGAFLAGMALAATPYREAISGRLSTVRDFLLVFFFIELGTDIDIGRLDESIVAVIVLSLVVLVGKPVIVAALLGLHRYRRSVSIRSALTLAQISEFSLILAALGVTQGHIGPDIAAVITAIALLTIAVSTQAMQHLDTLTARLTPLLGAFERRDPLADHSPSGGLGSPDYLVIGLGRFGSTVVEELIARGDGVIGVDFDPRIDVADRLGIPVVFGDAEDPTLVERLPLDATRWVISTVRGLEVNLALLSALRSEGYAGRVAVAAEDAAHCEVLREAGADVTVQPLHVAAGPLMDAIHGIA